MWYTVTLYINTEESALECTSTNVCSTCDVAQQDNAGISVAADMTAGVADSLSQ